ncbi:MAG: bifunctional [glutamate--ammonia ligase]-adenylyl-L-tyrosine [Pseudomonadota bacterium]|jgi:glutamate-ammonia-ligase adenylyltransferase
MPSNLNTLVSRRILLNSNILAVYTALIKYPNWNILLFNTQIKYLMNVDSLETLNIQQWHTGLRQFRYAAVAALAHLDHSIPIHTSETLIIIMHNMSAWADWALQWAVKVTGKYLALRYGEPVDCNNKPIDLQVVAMGKLGGYELNISSDIDLIFLARTLDGDTKGVDVQGALRQCSNNEFMQYWAKELIALLSTTTEYGFAFRVDMMLRPHGSAGLLVQEHAMLEDYLTTQGRMWERLAWLKARAIYTPCFETLETHQHNHLLWQAIIKPFVYRRYLDFTVLDALRDLHGRIRRERRVIESNPHQGLHLKLARGGIRELEFWLQGQQLIRAGRDASLRTKDTLTTLIALKNAGVITIDTCNNMTVHYILLRRAEHAVQYIDDAQTHLLPVAIEARSTIAYNLGFSHLTVFDEHISCAMKAVSNQFDTLFASELPKEPSNTTPLINTSARLELEQPYIQSALDAVQQWPLNDNSRLAVITIIETCVLNMFQNNVTLTDHNTAEITVKIEIAFQRLINFLKTISRRKTYLDILLMYPPVLLRVQALMLASPFAAQYLHNHPVLIDELIEGAGIHSVKDMAYWDLEKTRLWRRLNNLDEEAQLHILCESHQAWVLRILMQDEAQAMGGTLNIIEVSDALSMAADLILEAAMCCINHLLNGAFTIPDGMGIIAYGKLGGKELGYGSDLDIVFIYDEALAEQSSNYTAAQYIKLTQRLISWLSIRTSSGRLFEIDTALRPNGQAGMMLTTLNAFTEYQIGQAAGTHAWLWEHQAISRARLCVGSQYLRQSFNYLRQTILCLPREESILKFEVMTMRQRIALDKKNHIPDLFFDVKHSTGGMIDIEFAVQYAVLRYAAQYPDLCKNIGNVALLKVMSHLGLIPTELANTVGFLYQELREIQHRCQLQLQLHSLIHQTILIETDLLNKINAVKTLWQVLKIN